VANRRPWSRDELLAAFRLYCRTPFGKLHQRNPEIIDLAQLIGRSPSAVAMKGCNFASLDPIQHGRNIAGLGNVSRADRELWDAFHANAETIADEAEQAIRRLQGETPDEAHDEIEAPTGPTDVERTVRARRVQSFFRATVLASYDNSCAISGLSIPELINASHIIPWSTDRDRRADPRNGIALNALYDRAFDRGLITFDESLCVRISPRLRITDPPMFHRQTLLEIDGMPMRSPDRFGPDPEALEYHREHVFIHAVA